MIRGYLVDTTLLLIMEGLFALYTMPGCPMPFIDQDRRGDQHRSGYRASVKFGLDIRDFAL